MAAGAAWAGVAAVLKRRFGVLEVISTLMLNFVALYTVSYLVRGPLQEPARVYPQTSALAASARLPVIIPGQRLHLGFVVAVLASVPAIAQSAGPPQCLKFPGRGGGRHSVLPGAGLGDDSLHSHPLGQEPLTDRVVHLVRSGVIQVLTFEQHRGRGGGEALGVV